MTRDLPVSDAGQAVPDVPRERRTTIASLFALLVALAGAGVAVFLVREYISVTEGGLVEGLLCSGGSAFDCNAVASSEYASMLGFPVALWGLIFYIVMSILALATLWLRPAERAAAASLGVLAGCVALVFDAYLAWVMVERIGTVCLGCVASYGINLVLAGLFWWIDSRVHTPRDTRALFLSPAPLVAKLVMAALLLGGVAASMFTTYRSLEDVEILAREEADAFLGQAKTTPAIDMSRFDGQPSRGPLNAPVTIVVSSDFQCNYCRALSAHVEKLRKRMPDEIRVVFVNAPVSSQCNPTMDHDTHEDACWLAEIGECAAEQGKFWVYHDLLFHTLPQPQVTRANVTRYLGGIGLDVPRFQKCFEQGSGRSALEHDVALATELKLLGVPSIVINGYARRGGVYPKMLRDVVVATLRSASAGR